MLGGMAFEIGSQIVMNGVRGRPLIKCIDWLDVLAATVTGAFVPSALTELKFLKQAIPILPHSWAVAEVRESLVKIGYSFTAKTAAKAGAPPATYCPCDR
jgi:hypothetical protein